MNLLPTMPGPFALLCGLCCAFVWVEIFKIGKVKPFNCMKCMSGWFSLLIAFAFNVPFFYFYLAIGLTVGAIYSRIQMMYL